MRPTTCKRSTGVPMSNRVVRLARRPVRGNLGKLVLKV
jgi:hypothetical protein